MSHAFSIRIGMMLIKPKSNPTILVNTSMCMSKMFIVHASVKQDRKWGQDVLKCLPLIHVSVTVRRENHLIKGGRALRISKLEKSYP